MPSSPEKRKEQRRVAYERHKTLLATDPEYADKYRASRRLIDKNRRKKSAKEKVATLQQDLPEWRLKKPGRIVALCGWMHW